MFIIKLVTTIVRWAFIVLFVLVAGHLVHWRGNSISDHVKTTLGMVEGLRQPALAFAGRAEELGSGMKNRSVARELEKISAEERARLEKVLHH